MCSLPSIPKNHGVNVKENDNKRGQNHIKRVFPLDFQFHLDMIFCVNMTLILTLIEIPLM